MCRKQHLRQWSSPATLPLCGRWDDGKGSCCPHFQFWPSTPRTCSQGPQDDMNTAFLTDSGKMKNGAEVLKHFAFPMSRHDTLFITPWLHFTHKPSISLNTALWTCYQGTSVPDETLTPSPHPLMNGNSHFAPRRSRSAVTACRASAPPK